MDVPPDRPGERRRGYRLADGDWKFETGLQQIRDSLPAKFAVLRPFRLTERWLQPHGDCASPA